MSRRLRMSRAKVPAESALRVSDHTVQLDAQVGRQVGGLVGVVLLQKLDLVAYWPDALAGLFDVDPDFPAFGRSGNVDFDTSRACAVDLDRIGRLDHGGPHEDI